MFAELGQNFAIFSKNQKLSQLLGLSLIAIYKSLTAGFDSVNGFDPNNEVIPSCAPEELSNKRFYDALNGEVWMNNATLYGHADFMDPAWVPTILEVFT